MNSSCLDFEQPIIDLEEKIHYLIQINQKNGKINTDFDKEIQRLKKKYIELTQKIFSNLSAWQISQLARHPYRPHTADYIEHIFNDFDELSGDRLYADDKAIIGGIARLDNRPIMIIGHQKGRKIQDKIQRNFGMPAPEGYRKAHRLMKLAEQFNIPLITFVDTPGAYPGIGAEERGQAEAIAKNLQTMSTLKIPIICTIIGEGGSGGALAISIGDKINMLEYSTYSVISPEGCASILWKNIEKAPIAAEEMRIIAPQLKKLNLIDHVISEPIGGAHKNIAEISFSIKTQLLIDLSELDSLTTQKLINRRYNRLMNYGYC